jgi:hypothetical protein
MNEFKDYDIPDGLYFGVINRKIWLYHQDGFNLRERIDSLEFIFSTGLMHEGEYILCACHEKLDKEDYTDYRVGDPVIIKFENKKVKEWALWRNSEYYNRDFEYYQ